MLAVVAEVTEDWQVKDVPEPVVENGAVLVRVAECGICGSDFHLHKRAKKGLRPGHEAWGEILEAGQGVRNLKPGDKVAICAVRGCEECKFCHRGDEHLCTRRRLYGLALDLPGAFSERMVVAERNAIRIPAGLAPELTVFADPVAVCLHGLNLLNAKRVGTSVVFGLGPLGLFMALVLRDISDQVWGVDLDEARCAEARRLGLKAAVPNSEMIESLAAQGVDVSVEAVGGKGETLEDCIRILNPGGTLLLIGVMTSDPQSDMRPIQSRELRVNGVSVYRPDEFRAALDWLAAHADTVSLISRRRYPLREFLRAFVAAKNREALKIVVVP